MRIALGPLAPDNPDLGNAGLEDAVNCVPLDSTYGPFAEACWCSYSAGSSSAADRMNVALNSKVQ